jgi:hypothetical protein
MHEYQEINLQKENKLDQSDSSRDNSIMYQGDTMRNDNYVIDQGIGIGKVAG